ncbi:hypothetical protein H2509_03650 [Stappia sp. F7233]|uniref:Yip1 domain-containing protein n=1 Tax=Stappia albiluteola TaxID=2758565 RepID=A0A839AB09_9HYPH|nr:hypothetical protein [Stappia albiluteola]MBA5776214.1 hypothetical protein [Stappia albiluteola]
MLTGEEIRRSFFAAWALFKGQPEGMRDFDLSVTGFWRSFLVYFLLLPPFFLSALAERKLIFENGRRLTGDYTDGLFFTSQAVGATVDWLLLPTVLLALARPLGIQRGYVPFVIARNWSSLVAAIAYTVPALLYLIGILSAGLMIFLTFVAMVVVLRYRYFIARVALDAPVGLAVGVVALDFLLSVMIGVMLSRITGI